MNVSAFTLPGTIEAARALAKALGPLLCASDDSADLPAILAAQANHDIREPGWCKGHVHADHREPGYEAYYRDQATGSHDWMCCTCRKITQTG
jgi:hypothetical protein